MLRGDSPDRETARTTRSVWAREGRDVHLAPFSDEAEWLSWLVSGRKLGWMTYDDGTVVEPTTAHGEHIFDSSCAVCKVGHAPAALRVVIDAVLDAHYDDEARALEASRHA